jgi:hypothetical protein
MGNTEKTRRASKFVNQLSKSVRVYALVCEGTLRDLVDFRIGTEVISSHATNNNNKKHTGLRRK